MAGEYRLEVPKEERDQTIFLVDKYRNKEVDLSKDAYTFFADKGTFDDRFELRVSSVVTSSGQIEEEKVDIYVCDRYIYVQAPANSEIFVYSVTGKQLVAEKTTRGSWSRSFPAGIYLVRVDEKSQSLIIH